MKAAKKYFPVWCTDVFLLGFQMWPFKWKLQNSTFLWCFLLCHIRWFHYIVCGSNPKMLKCKLLSTNYFLVRLSTKLYNVILTFVCVDEILMCAHLNESYWATVSCSAVNYTMESGCNIWVSGSNHRVQALKGKVPSRILLWCCALCCVKWFLFYSLWMRS